MSSFLYLIDAATYSGAIPSKEHLMRIGLFEVLGRGYQALQLADGNCLLASSVAGAVIMRHDPANQTWRDRSNCPGVKIGWWNDERRPTERGLARPDSELPKRFDTRIVEMGIDAAPWRVPVLKRGVQEEVTLPYLMQWNAGLLRWDETIAARHCSLQSLVERQTAQTLRDIGCAVESDAEPMFPADQARMIREALGLVYRVAESEIDALELLSERAVIDAIGVIINKDSIVEFIADFGRAALLAIDEAGGDS